MGELRAVKVHWVDSATHGEREEYRGDEDGLTPLEAVSVGLLVREDARSVTIATDYFAETKHYRTLMTIPRCSISNIVEYQEPKAS